MSYFSNDTPLVPRNGHTLIAGIVARISGCQNQKELSLEDQVDHGKEVVRDMYDGPVDYRIISTKGKGERLDRPELAGGWHPTRFPAGAKSVDGFDS